MKIHKSSDIQGQAGEREDKGFTLIEILIAIVLIGILSAVAVVGISSLVGQGGKSACIATRDSAVAASAVYFTTHSPAVSPDIPNAVDFTELTTPVGNAPMTLPSGVVVGTPATTLVGSGWTLTMAPGTATAAPTFSGCPA